MNLFRMTLTNYSDLESENIRKSCAVAYVTVCFKDLMTPESIYLSEN